MQHPLHKECLQVTLQPEQENWDEFHDVDIVNWKRVRSALEHENLLVNHRLTWLLSSQAFLFAAFAIIFQESAKNDVDPNRRVLYQFILAGLSITGVLVAFYIQRPIRTAEIQHENLVKWWRMQKLRDINAHPPICGEPSRRDRYLPQSNFPIVFVSTALYGIVLVAFGSFQKAKNVWARSQYSLHFFDFCGKGFFIFFILPLVAFGVFLLFTYGYQYFASLIGRFISF
jgi:hypothetical protein